MSLNLDKQFAKKEITKIAKILTKNNSNLQQSTAEMYVTKATEIFHEMNKDFKAKVKYKSTNEDVKEIAKKLLRKPQQKAVTKAVTNTPTN